LVDRADDDRQCPLGRGFENSGERVFRRGTRDAADCAPGLVDQVAEKTIELRFARGLEQAGGVLHFIGVTEHRFRARPPGHSLSSNAAPASNISVSGL
jgi:hypothetical protein